MTKEWHFQYPSTSVSTSLKGDRDYAQTFHGEGQKLLYQLKNNMKFQKLGQLKMTRVFTDGTVITAKSHFGYDSIEIDVSKSTLVTPTMETCTITFTYLNAYVPPMRYPGEVRTGEEDGIDYVKSYYSIDTAYCPSCEDEVEWEFTFNYVTTEQIDYYDSEPNNHCVYSQDAGCSGEIIEQGRDDGGNYIIWKVYTEASNHNRSGLGYAQFHAMLKNKNTEEIICEFDEIIGVDCCEKDTTLRNIAIWWENASAGNSISYNGLTLYRVPEVILTSVLDQYIVDAKSFYALTEDENGSGCLSFEWTLTGYGILSSSNTNTASIQAEGTPRTGIQETNLSVIDRCGSTDTFNATPCCETANPLHINYTTLQMSCYEKQDLEAHEGCPPYHWSLSGGGSLSETEGIYTTYTAPDTNVDCMLNPTITLTDLCNTIVELKLAVNCAVDYSGVGAFGVRTWEMGECREVYVPPPSEHYYWEQQEKWVCARYFCDGTIIPQYDFGPPVWVWRTSPCEDMCCTRTECFWEQCGKSICEGFQDFRTEIMKNVGCCPINPITGLPFSV